MLQANRRSALKLLGGAALTAGAVPAFVTPAAAQEYYVASKYQNFKRGTIDSMNPESRTFTVVWTDLGRFKLKVSDLVVKTGGASDGNSYEQLKPGQIVDVQWYDYVDFLIAPASPAAMQQAASMKQIGARIEGVPGSKPVMRLWEMRRDGLSAIRAGDLLWGSDELRDHKGPGADHRSIRRRGSKAVANG